MFPTTVIPFSVIMFSESLHFGQSPIYDIALISAVTSIGVWLITRAFHWWTTTSKPNVPRSSTPDLEKKSVAVTREPGGELPPATPIDVLI